MITKSKKILSSLDSEIEGYKKYIDSLGPEFINFIEYYNKIVNEFENIGFIGNIGLKARIKDFSSAYDNTRKKAVDDVFGIEIVTPNEFAKEIMILFNVLVFQTLREKSYNKENGYIAYHSLTSLKKIDNIEKIDISDIIRNYNVNEYNMTIIDDQEKANNNKKFVSPFKELIEYINIPENEKKLNIIMKKLLYYANNYPHMEKINETPLIEFQLKTSDVAENSLRGTASHYLYKNVNQKEVINKFINKQFIRGLNAPWRFVRQGRNLVAQRFIDTITDNWAFLNEYISNELMNKEDCTKDNESINRAFGTIFPFFAPYILSEKECQIINNMPVTTKREIWGELKKYILADKTNYSYSIEELRYFQKTLALIKGGNDYE